VKPIDRSLALVTVLVATAGAPSLVDAQVVAVRRAPVVASRPMVAHIGVALGHGFLQRTGRELVEYPLGIQNATRSLNGQSISVIAGLNLGQHLGLAAEYTFWNESEGELLRSVLLGPALRFGKRTAVLARAAVGRLEAPIAEEWWEGSGPSAEYFYVTSTTHGFGGQLSWGVERLFWRTGAVQVLLQWTMATLPDSRGRSIHYDYGSLRAGGVLFLEPKRYRRR
jgi:hypothetical protein